VSVVRTSFPALYESRLVEIKKEKESWDKILPIFFYNDTLFPFSPLSLHLFEPRYKVMCKRIVNGSRKFAYLPCFQSYSAKPGDVGVSADLTDVEFLPDGRALLQAKCRERFKVLDAWVEDGTQGLHWCKVELLPDDPPPTTDEEDSEAMAAKVRAQAGECSQIFDTMMGRFGGLRSEIDSTHGPKPVDNAERLSFWLASVLPVNYVNKHSLLTTRCTLTRLGVLKTFMLEHLSASQSADSGSHLAMGDDLVEEEEESEEEDGVDEQETV